MNERTPMTEREQPSSDLFAAWSTADAEGQEYRSRPERNYDDDDPWSGLALGEPDDSPKEMTR